MASHIRFDRFRFDPATQRLWDGDAEVRLTPKAGAVLALLVARGGEPVTKEALFSSVWPDTVVSDDALTTCVVELRRALDDDARRPRFIETRHRRGYRFVAATALSEDVRPAADGATPAAREPGVASLEVAAIAVLPFADMSPGRDHDYLCEGLAEELINALTQVDGLRVVARTASFRFRQIGADILDVGQQLKASALLEGSVRKAGARLRVTESSSTSPPGIIAGRSDSTETLATYSPFRTRSQQAWSSRCGATA